MRALHTAATGMMAQELNVQVISNNIANMRTTGYKRQRAEFQDLLYEHVSRVGTQTSTQGNILPVGIELGGGVKTVGTPRVMTQGTLLADRQRPRRRHPRRRLVQDRDAGRHLHLYPRRLVPDGRAGPHRHPAGQRRAARHHHPAELAPRSRSTRRARFRRPLPGSTTPTVLGQITLTRFVNKAGLQAIGDNLFIETPASGTPQDSTPGTDGIGDLQQGNLEQANVEAVTEISDLISAQRAYEMNSKVITAADQMLQATANLMR